MKRIVLPILAVALAACVAQPSGLTATKKKPRTAQVEEDQTEEEGEHDHTKHDGGPSHGDGHETGEAEEEEAPAGDAGKPGGPVNAFTGAAAFTPGAPPHAANDHHSTSMTGRACLGCHTGGTAPKFLFAGTVYRGTQPAAGAQVRVVDATGKLQGSAYSDADGNFWVQKSTALAPALAGARTATKADLMKATFSSGDCNSSSCHGANNRIDLN